MPLSSRFLEAHTSAGPTYHILWILSYESFVKNRVLANKKNWFLTKRLLFCLKIVKKNWFKILVSRNRLNTCLHRMSDHHKSTSARRARRGGNLRIAKNASSLGKNRKVTNENRTRIARSAYQTDILALKLSRIFGHCNNPALHFCPCCGCVEL